MCSSDLASCHGRLTFGRASRGAIGVGGAREAQRCAPRPGAAIHAARPSSPRRRDRVPAAGRVATLLSSGKPSRGEPGWLARAARARRSRPPQPPSTTTPPTTFTLPHLQAIEKWGTWGQIAPGVANGQSEIKLTKLEFSRPDAVASRFDADEGFTGLVQVGNREAGGREGAGRALGRARADPPPLHPPPSPPPPRLRPSSLKSATVTSSATPPRPATATAAPRSWCRKRNATRTASSTKKRTTAGPR